MRILKILKNFEFAENIEITIESNPNSLTSEKTKIYFESGINRISIGAQSFNDKILKEIGRIHKSSDIYNAVENAKSAGFKNINLDLMLALPHQKFSDIEKSINCIEELKIPHTSYYSLILEEDTQLYEMHKKVLYLFPQKMKIEKCKNLMDKFMRLQADFSNYKRRTETQKSEFVELGVKKIVNDLLPVIDNFERAMDSIGDKDSTYDGIRMIKDQLTDVLKNEGIVEMKALGEEFDPMYHHAVLTEDSDEYESGYVIEVLQKGYLIDDKTLRPAMVKVSQ